MYTKTNEIVHYALVYDAGSRVLSCFVQFVYKGVRISHLCHDQLSWCFEKEII